jgi:putative transposase
MQCLLQEIADPEVTVNVSWQCRELEIPRAAFYRAQTAATAAPETDLQEVREQIMEIATAQPRYGYRRVTAELNRRGLAIGRKMVWRLMGQANLLCRKSRRHAVATTNSKHQQRIYLNLVPELELTGPDQLWVADVTYIRLRRDWVYLAVLMDSWSRRCIGWELSPSINTELTLAALRHALAERQATPHTVHHSDRGSTYASREYIDLLRQHGIRVSMSRRGNPYDNARMESFIKTLKHEEVNLTEYEDIEEAQLNIGRFIEDVYNHKRLHSALGYRSPVEYEVEHQRINSKASP